MPLRRSRRRLRFDGGDAALGTQQSANQLQRPRRGAAGIVEQLARDPAPRGGEMAGVLERADRGDRELVRRARRPSRRSAGARPSRD